MEAIRGSTLGIILLMFSIWAFLKVAENSKIKSTREEYREGWCLAAKIK